jgi:hypothetical protein
MIALYEALWLHGWNLEIDILQLDDTMTYRITDAGLGALATSIETDCLATTITEL